MSAEKKRCTGCEHDFPATTEFFYAKSDRTPGSKRLDYVCRPCRIAVNRAAEAKRKAAQASVEMVGPVKPKRQGRPVAVKEPKQKKQKQPKPERRPARCPLPYGVAMRSAWRGPVPAGYGAAA